MYKMDMVLEPSSVLKKLRVLFDKMHYGNIISWNVMIIGYERNGFRNL